MAEEQEIQLEGETSVKEYAAYGAVGLGGIYLVKRYLPALKYKRLSIQWARKLRDELDNPEDYNESDYQEEIEEARGDTQTALNELEGRDCKKPFTYDEALDEQPVETREKALYWKRAAIKSNADAAGCINEGVLSDIRNALIGLAVAGVLTGGLRYFRGGRGGGGGGRVVNIVTISPSHPDFDDVIDNIVEGGETVEYAMTPSSIPVNSPVPEDLVERAVDYIGIGIDSAIVLTTARINTLADIVGESYEYLSNNPKVAGALLLVAIIAAFAIAEPTPLGEAIGYPIATGILGAVGLSVPRLASLAPVGRAAL